MSIGFVWLGFGSSLLPFQDPNTMPSGVYSSSHSSYSTTGDMEHGLIGHVSKLIVEVSRKTRS